MELLVIRHAQAEDESLTGLDRDRALTNRGRRQARALGHHFAGLKRTPDLVLSSPLVRARDTASLFCEAAGLGEPILENWLACGMRPEEAVLELSSYRDFSRVTLVGHQPDFGHLAEFLTGSAEGRIRVRKASVMVFTLSQNLCKGVLEAVLPWQYLDV